MTTAREFLKYAGVEETEENFFYLSHYVGKSGNYFVSFPDADVLDQDGNDLAEQAEEPANFQEYLDAQSRRA